MARSFKVASYNIHKGVGTDRRRDPARILGVLGEEAQAFFGGTVSPRYVLITRSQDDGVDIDVGWRGTMQFLAIQQDAAGDVAVVLTGQTTATTPLVTPDANGDWRRSATMLG